MTGWNPDAELTDGQELVRLRNGAQSLLSKYDEFLKGDYDSIPDSEVQDQVVETDLTADLGTLDNQLREIKSETTPQTGDSDPETAIAVHRNVDISRSDAADSGLWSAFSMLYYPWFVHHRWAFNSVSAMKEKFWTQARALDGKASTFERAWWIAELTCVEKSDGSIDYEPTRRALSKRRFSLLVFDTPMARYKPAVRALLEVLYDEPDDDEKDDEEGGLADTKVVDETIKRFRKSGSVFPYEGQTKDELADTIRDIREEVEAKHSTDD
ncbi:hypothetical protein E2L06_20180 [Haloterrigena sp. H1]|uniref:DUF6339 family protein n=1 Tax=Haloterrigena sp. H1 TaxID=2552943 RepID=UPI00110DA403|nr:DUF6339 family protein [Haloterrigena sp. H1]TMT79132.1 hypothetical protein E2L06_20180 [Haloterrigena sp. H1]